MESTTGKVINQLQCRICMQKLCATCHTITCKRCMKQSCALCTKSYGDGTFVCNECDNNKRKSRKIINTTTGMSDPKNVNVHVHYECVQKTLDERLDSYVMRYDEWKDKAKQVYQTYGKGIILFDHKEDDTTNIYHLYDQDIENSLPRDIDYNKTFVISAKIWDNITQTHVCKRRLVGKTS